MKLMTFTSGSTGHFGVLLSGNRVLDVTATAGGLPSTLMTCIEQGEPALAALRARVAAVESALQRGERPANVVALDQIELQVPIRPGKIMAIGKNYADHVAEGSGKAYSRVSGFIKLSHCIVPHKATIVKPRWTESWDYENELAVVMGTHCCEVPPEDVYKHVFGYTILNDISARDVQMAERKEGNICIGKNFPTSSPLGPWIVTKDEIPDPHNLRLVTRVNGEVRQDSTTGKQIYRIPEQIVWYSHAGFEPGDMISTGTPSGTGLGYKGAGSWYLKHGDHIECEVEGIGILANTCHDPRA